MGENSTERPSNEADDSSVVEAQSVEEGHSREPRWQSLLFVVWIVLYFPFVILFILLFPLWVLVFAVWGALDYRKHIRTLRSQGRLIPFREALEIVDKGEGCFVIIETMKGPMGEVWLASGDDVEAAMSLPTLEERAGWHAMTGEKDLRLQYYAPYGEALSTIFEKVVDDESGAGKLVRMKWGERGQVDEHARTRVALSWFDV